MRSVRFPLLALVALVLASAPLFAADYVLTAPKWDSAQSAAVEAAGGKVRYAHASGFALVSSDDAGFASRVNASKAFTEILSDIFTQWQKPRLIVEAAESAVTPGNETFAAVQWAPTAVNAQGAWKAGFTGAGVRVAVIDGGIYNTHADLKGSVDAARSMSFVPGFAFNEDTGTFWHGTHVAGIIAARDNNAGIIGIAPGATIVGVKVLHNGTGNFGAIIAGILYAATPIAEGGGGADIINMSLGAEFERRGGAGSLVSELAKACNYAASKGVLVVVAAGNSAIDLGQSRDFISVPAESGSAIAVSASGPLGFGRGATNFHRRASYSNYGEGAIYVAGPGGDFALPGSALCNLPRQPGGTITQYCWVLDMVISTVRGSGTSTTSYSWTAGTSMAAPAVAAVAALAKEAHPGISLGALKTLLARSADAETPREFYGHGYPNAGNAVQ